MLTTLTAAETGGATVLAASGATQLIWLVVALPLLGALVLLVGGRRTDSFGPLLATGLSWGAFVVGLLSALNIAGYDAGERARGVSLWDWVTAGPLEVNVGMLVDPLSIAFVLLVTFVGSLIHVYSLGYMAHDPAKRRFFAYLNLFVAAMLTLVLADSYLLLFVGWEGVGLASYLLIGFWNYNPEYATAANKAFIVNRVGDVGLLVAMMLMFHEFGSLTFAEVLTAAPGADEKVLTLIGLALLLGACGKSAQFPLHSWLGDAMAGPTPVSALIHAATMVTAGVYLVVRSHTIFEGAPNAQLAVVVVGAITLVYGAIVGSAKDDIKKALAASTMSQIGYMMLAAGLGPVGYAFAIFHLLTHGFFKAGMFLGAGSVMHGMNNEVNMRRFGGVSTAMKVTWVTFGLGWLAILGVPPFSGFWSKDKIIEAAFVGDGWRPWVFGLVTLLGAGLTAFYMSRLFFMTFHGRKRWEDDMHPHESPSTMTVPMVILAVGSAGLGLVLGVTGWIQDWLAPVVGEAHEHHPVVAVPVIQVATVALVLLGTAYAYLRYARADVPVVAPTGSVLTRAARRDLFQDDVNEAFFRRPGAGLVSTLTELDEAVVDGAVDGAARGVSGTSGLLRLVQNGYVRSYALTMLIGTVAVLGFVWVMN